MSLQRIGIGGRRRRKSSGGRRANYAPAKSEVGWRKYLPITWVNWLGFVLFGLITIALAFQFVANVSDLDRYGNDWIASSTMTVAFAIMTYLFGSTRFKE